MSVDRKDLTRRNAASGSALPFRERSLTIAAELYRERSSMSEAPYEVLRSYISYQADTQASEGRKMHRVDENGREGTDVEDHKSRF